MKFTDSLKKNQDFQIGYKEGKSYANKYLIMYVRPNGIDRNRLGISVSKKVGNSVVRHRIKRLVKENYRLNEERFRCGVDIIIIGRKDAVGRDNKEIGSALLHLGHLHNIIDEKTGQKK